ncbi:MAG: DUF3540 domain-containing protein [Polyangiaceae bacterium]
MNALIADPSSNDAPPSGVVDLSARPRRLKLASGAQAVASGNQLEILDTKGQLVARFDSETGNLTLRAAGDLELVSAGALRLKSEQGVEIDAPRIAERCEQYSLKSREAELVVARWKLEASRIIERSTDVYRRVERVYETRAESIRTVARGALSLLAEKATLRSKEETRVDGKRVLLG